MKKNSGRKGSTEFLSAAALDYYRRFGRQHGIDKYFRNVDFNDLNLYKASSESSLQSLRDEDNVSDRVPATKSCNNLHEPVTDVKVDPNNLVRVENVFVTSDDQNSSKSLESEQDQSSLEQVISEKEDSSQKDNEVQEIVVVSNVEDNQTINLNIQSKVEIKLPDQYLNQQQFNVQESKSEAQPVVAEPFEPKSLPEAPVPPIHAFYPTYIFPPPAQTIQVPTQKVVYSTDTQTTPQLPEQKLMNTSETQTTYKRDIKDVETDITEEPIKPTVTNRKDTINPVNISPTSSVAFEKNLEWDSWGDIGYHATSHTFQACAASELDETEKQAVNRYCLEQGIEFQPNVIVVRNTPKSKKTIEKFDQQQSEAIKKRAIERKEQWKQIFKKYKDKYHESSSQTTLRFSNPGAQSTPKMNESKVSKKSNSNVIDCSVQTSQIDLLCKSIQVETDIDESNLTEPKSDNNDTCNDSSFVFVKPAKPISKKESSESKPKHKSRSQSTAADSTKSSSRKSTLDDSFENELKMAIALMNSVLESKSLHVALKKSLVVKIMQKIMNLKLQHSNRSNNNNKSCSKESNKNSLSDVSTLKSSRSSKMVS